MMKNTAWNILAVVGLLATVALALVYLAIFSNPDSSLNPFPPPTSPDNLKNPIGTATSLHLPATWTPKPPEPTDVHISATPIPTSTNFVLMTNTSNPGLTETPQPLIVEVTGTPTAYKFYCNVSISKPLDGGPVEKGTDFDGRWEVTNEGTETWADTQVQMRFIGGTKLQTKRDFIDLDHDVEPGDSISFLLDMRAPSEVGTYYATWGLMDDDITICHWTIAIRVP